MANVIVVGVDGSETSRHAAKTAAELAAASDATLHILTAFDKAEMERVEVGHDVWVITSADGAEQVANRAAEELRQITKNVESSPLYGKPAEALVAEAKRLEARLIVVGNKRMQGMTRVLGSVANTVSHTAPCDVYIVKTV